MMFYQSGGLRDELRPAVQRLKLLSSGVFQSAKEVFMKWLDSLGASESYQVPDAMMAGAAVLVAMLFML